MAEGDGDGSRDGGVPGGWRWPRKMEAAQGDRDGSRGWRKKRRWGGGRYL